MVLEEPRSKNIYIYIYLKKEGEGGQKWREWRQKEDVEAPGEGEKESMRRDGRVQLKEGWSTRMVSRRSLAVWHLYSANYRYTPSSGCTRLRSPRIDGADFTAPFVG